MQLTTSQVSTIANAFRALSDEELAALWIERIVNQLNQPEPKSGPRLRKAKAEAAASSAPTEPSHVFTEQHFDGETHQKLVRIDRHRKRKVVDQESKTPLHERQIDYIQRHPGCKGAAMRQALGEFTEMVWFGALKKALGGDKVYKEGNASATTYWPKVAA